MKKKLAKVVVANAYGALADLQSYVGGQILMLTVARYRHPGEKKPREICRRGHVNSIVADGNYLRVEFEWVAIKFGGTYYEDSSSTTVDIRVDEFSKSRKYSLMVQSFEDDLKMIFCFVEPGSVTMTREKVRKTRKAT